MSNGIHITHSDPRPGTTEGKCVDHPNASSTPGFGFAGGGFGPYSICDECGKLFDKQIVYDYDEEDCPGHVGGMNNPKICINCGTHVDSLRPPEFDF